MKGVDMTLNQAKQTVCPFSKHRGRTLDQIAMDDPMYLDWMAGLDDLRGSLAEAVPIVAKAYATEIESAMEDRDGEE